MLPHSVESGLDFCSCRDGNTALHLACQSNQLKVIEILLQWGARPNMQNASGFAPVRKVFNCTCSHNGDCIGACSADLALLACTDYQTRLQMFA